MKCFFLVFLEMRIFVFVSHPNPHPHACAERHRVRDTRPTTLKMHILLTSASTYTSRQVYGTLSLMEGIHVTAAVEESTFDPNLVGAKVKYGDAALNVAFDVLLLFPPADARQRAQHAMKWINRVSQLGKLVKHVILVSPLPPRGLVGVDGEYFRAQKKVEQMIQQSGTAWTILQTPVYHHQLFDYVRTCAQSRVTSSETSVELTLPFPLQRHLLPPTLDVRDLAVSITYLLDRWMNGEGDFVNQTCQLVGAEQLSGTELAGSVARGLLNGDLLVAVKYVDVGLEEFLSVWRGVVEEELGSRATPELIDAYLWPVANIADATSRGAWDLSVDRAEEAMRFTPDDFQDSESTLFEKMTLLQHGLRFAQRSRPFTLADYVRIHKEEIISLLKRWQDSPAKTKWIVRGLSAPIADAVEAKPLLIVEPEKPDTGYANYLDEKLDNLDEDKAYEYVLPRASGIPTEDEPSQKPISSQEWIRRWHWRKTSKL
jgi:hypothetical protein